MRKYIFLLMILLFLPSKNFSQLGEWGIGAGYMRVDAFVDSLNNYHFITSIWEFAGDSVTIINLRVDTLSVTDWIAGQPDLNLNPTALGDVKLFGGAGSIADGDDGKRLVIIRGETGDRDSVVFYIDQYSISQITGTYRVRLNAGDIIQLSSSGDFEFLDGSTSIFDFRGDKDTKVQVVFQVRSATGNQLVIGDDNKDYDRPLLTMPAFYIFGAKDPDSSNQDFVGILHDSSNARFITGQALGVGSNPQTRENGFMFAPHDTAAFFIMGDGTITKDSTGTEVDSIVATFGDVRKIVSDTTDKFLLLTATDDSVISILSITFNINMSGDTTIIDTIRTDYIQVVSGTDTNDFALILGDDSDPNTGHGFINGALKFGVHTPTYKDSSGGLYLDSTLSVLAWVDGTNNFYSILLGDYDEGAYVGFPDTVKIWISDTADLMILRTAFAGSLNNDHTITGIWDFTGDSVIVDKIVLKNSEIISNAVDDEILFQGVGGADNTNLKFDLDGVRPIISSPTDNTIEIADILRVTVTSAGAIAEQLQPYNTSNTVGTGTKITFNAQNSSSAAHPFAQISGEIDVNTAGSEDGTIRLSPYENGSLTDYIVLDGNKNMIELKADSVVVDEILVVDTLYVNDSLRIGDGTVIINNDGIYLGTVNIVDSLGNMISDSLDNIVGASSPHAYGAKFDTNMTLTINAKNVWHDVTSSTGRLITWEELVGFTIVGGDTIGDQVITPNNGHYNGYAVLDYTGNKAEFEGRFSRKGVANDSTLFAPQWFDIPFNNDSVSVVIPYQALNVMTGDTIKLQVRNLSSTSDLVIHAIEWWIREEHRN